MIFALQESEIIKWSKIRYIKENVVPDYIKFYTRIENLLYLIEIKQTETSMLNNYTISETVAMIKSFVNSSTLETDIMIPFMFGFKYNIAKI